MARTIRLIAVLSRRFARSRSFVVGAVPSLATALALVATFVVMQSFALSADQVVERDFGRHEALVPVPVSPAPGDDRLVAAFGGACREAGATDCVVMLRAIDVRVAIPAAPRSDFLEADWPLDPLGNRLILRDGRWPTRPGEAVVTNPGVIGTAAVIGAELPVLSGRQRLRIVGTATDRYARFPSMLAAPGTWASWDPTLTEDFTSLGISPWVYWSGAEPAAMATAVAAAVAATGGATGDDAAEQNGVTAEALLAATRIAAEARPQLSWLERVPAAYLVPSLLLPVLAVGLAFALDERRHRRRVDTLRSVGLRPGTAAAAVGVTATVWAVVAALVGVAAGAGIGLLARPVVERFRIQPLPPIPSMWDPLLRITGLTLLGGVLISLWLAAARPTRRAAASGRRVTDLGAAARTARLFAAAAAAGACLLLLPWLNSPPKAMVLAAVFGLLVLLTAPELIHGALRVLPARGPRCRLMARQLTANGSRTVTAVVVLGAVLGTSLGFTTLLGTMIATAADGVRPEVQPGLVQVASRGGPFGPPSATTAEVVAAQLPGRRPAQLRYLHGTGEHVYLADTRIGAVLALDSTDDLTELLGYPLDDRAATVLGDGGLLVWRGGATTEQTIAVRDGADSVLRRTPPLQVAETRDPRTGWSRSVAAILLTATARDLGLPIADGCLFYGAVPPEQAARARQAVIDAGLDPRQVLVHVPPPPVVPATALSAAALCLFVLVLVVCAAVARSQVRLLRGYTGTLITLGVPPWWARWIVLLQQAVVAGLAVLLAALMAIPPVVLSVWRLPDFVLGFPVSWMVGTVVCFLAAVAAASALSTLRLAAGDRAFRW